MTSLQEFDFSDDSYVSDAARKISMDSWALCAKAHNKALKQCEPEALRTCCLEWWARLRSGAEYLWSLSLVVLDCGHDRVRIGEAIRGQETRHHIAHICLSSRCLQRRNIKQILARTLAPGRDHEGCMLLLCHARSQEKHTPLGRLYWSGVLSASLPALLSSSILLFIHSSVLPMRRRFEIPTLAPSDLNGLSRNFVNVW